MKGKNGIVGFSRARVSRKKVSPGWYGGNIAIFFGLIVGGRGGVAEGGGVAVMKLRRGGEGAPKLLRFLEDSENFRKVRPPVRPPSGLKKTIPFEGRF